MSRNERPLLAALVLVGLLFYLGNAAHYVDQPLRIEESEWSQMGRATFEHGKPQLPAEENQRIRFLPDGSLEDVTYNGLWHPPLYMHTMATFMVFAGADATTSLRLIGALGMLACCAFLFLLAREVAPRRTAFRLGAISSFLLLVHPYAIQGSLFLDIDTSVYPVAFMFFLWVLARFERRGEHSLGSALLLGVALAVVLWCKLTTVLLLVPILPLFWMARLGVLRGLLRGSVVLATGAVTFFATYGLYIWITGQSFWYTFDFTFGKTSGLVVWKQEGTTALEYSLHLQVAWFIPALLILAAVYGIVALRRWIRDRRVTVIDLIWTLGAAILVFYAVVVPNGSIYESKYALPALPMIIFAVTALVLRMASSDGPDSKAVDLPRVSHKWMAVAVTGLVSAAVVVLMPDLITGQQYMKFTSVEKLAIVGGSGLALLAAAWSSGIRGYVPAGVITVLAVFFVVQGVDSYRADTSPLFTATDTKDFIRSGEIVNDELRPGEVALVSKDLGVRIDDRIIEGEDIWLVRGDAFEAFTLRLSPWLTVIASNGFGPPIGPLTKDVMAECFTEQKLGRQVSIWVRREKCGRAPLESSR